MRLTVSVVIVTWNSEVFIDACLTSLYNQTFTHLDVIIVDNHSTDRTLEILQTYPNLRLFKQTENLGFSKGQNIGISEATGDYLFLLNPDVILTKDYVEKLVQVAEKQPQVGTVTGKLLLSESGASCQSPGVIDSVGFYLEKTRRQRLHGYQDVDSERYNQQHYIFGGCAAASLYRKAMLEACKFEGQYFDEAFFVYKEDIDLAWRAQLLGWKSIYTPHAVAFHRRAFKPNQRSDVSPEIRMHSVKNRYLLLIKNELFANFLRHSGYILLYDIKILIYLLLFERSSLVGLVTVIRLLPAMLCWRRFIMKHKKVDETYMLAWMK
ncbi:MAG: glycosyltransferase family 2 protein [Anaerolineae bacterium]|nr:glycosyltransferase family 2 protein [Anaerolineae bacterium]